MLTCQVSLLLGSGGSVAGKGREQTDMILLEREEAENFFVSGGNK